MALGSTQPLTEMSTRDLPGGKRRPVREADNLTTICELSLERTKIWSWVPTGRETKIDCACETSGTSLDWGLV
jgi:hypothetical protein